LDLRKVRYRVQVHVQIIGSGPLKRGKTWVIPGDGAQGTILPGWILPVMKIVRQWDQILRTQIGWLQFWTLILKRQNIEQNTIFQIDGPN
jgi:hypothetical protein